LKFLTDNLLLIAIAFISGGMLLWPLINRRSAGPVLDTLSATRLINDGAVVVDVRANNDFSTGHLPAAKNIPLEDFEKRLSEIPANKAVLIVCESGQRSGKASGLLKKSGRSEVFGLAGGISAWRQAGLPVVK
jgi:rhodanese-related sulfurtransferase